MNDVIVIGSNYSTALGTVRAVGLAGFNVRLLSTTKECAKIIGNSKYIVKTVVCSNDFDSIYESMEKLRGNDKIIPVIPTSDLSMLLIDSHANLLREHYCFPNICQTQGEITKWMDKFKQKKLAETCGLSVAKGKVYPANEDGIKEAISETIFPCVTKAISSEDCLSSKEIFRICSDAKELDEIMRLACDRNCSYILVEQLIEIEKEYATYGLAYNGKVLMPACLDAWRTGHGAHKGVAAEGAMLKPSFLGDVKEKLENFVRSIGLNGLFCIDLIYSKGIYYFVELNLRYGASGFAATIGGANLPGLYADIMLNGAELDENVSLQYEPVFLSEKVDLDDYRVGFMSWKEYKEHQKGNKVHFMKSDDDPRPWKQFQKLEQRKHLARIFRGKRKRH